jgi:hypothetical protein
MPEATNSKHGGPCRIELSQSCVLSSGRLLEL